MGEGNMQTATAYKKRRLTPNISQGLSENPCTHQFRVSLRQFIYNGKAYSMPSNCKSKVSAEYPGIEP